MKIFLWIVDLVLPITMIIIGLVYKYNAPEKVNNFHGYRTKQSMKSQEAWDYAHKHLSLIFTIMGVILLIYVIISKFVVPIERQYLSVINAGIGILALIIPIPIIDLLLRRKCFKSK
ncbi:MAG: SdpI family protein [Vallitalea sp.]|jgi:uncharacterized membrane protein|nr:SdpI family protein [Vallitalea sp.]